MSLPRTCGRWWALAAVVAGVALFTLGVRGVTEVDTRLEVAATAQKVAAAKHKASPPRQRDRKRV